MVVVWLLIFIVQHFIALHNLRIKLRHWPRSLKHAYVALRCVGQKRWQQAIFYTSIMIPVFCLLLIMAM